MEPVCHNTSPSNNVLYLLLHRFQGNGIMYVFADRPLGPSLERQQELGIPHHPKDIPLLAFTGNVAHSNSKVSPEFVSWFLKMSVCIKSPHASGQETFTQIVSARRVTVHGSWP